MRTESVVREGLFGYNMDDPETEHEAWLAAYTPTLFAYIRNQRPRSVPFKVPSVFVSSSQEAADSPLNLTLEDMFRTAKISSFDSSLISDTITICEFQSKGQEARCVKLLKIWMLTSPSADTLLVYYQHWVYLPGLHTCVKNASHAFLSLPAVTLDGVLVLVECFQENQCFKANRLESCLLQYELLHMCCSSFSDLLSILQLGATDLEICIGLKSLFDTQSAAIQTQNLHDLYRLNREAQEPIAFCQVIGCSFDIEAHSSTISLWKVKLQNYEFQLNDIFGAVNFGSNQQLSSALSHYLEKIGEADLLRKWPKTFTKLLKTGTDTLRLFRSNASIAPVLDLLIEYRALLKADSTFGKSLQAHVSDCRIHSTYKLNGCVTGRLSSSDPNLQNIPRTVEFRRLFKASPGWKLIIGDYSQIELRMAAVLSKDPEMLRCYRRKEDLHRITASAILGAKISSVTQEQRQLAKAVNFGILYGQGAKGLSKYCLANYEIHISEEEAKVYINKFYTKFQSLRKWQERVLSLPTASTPLGRHRTLQGFCDNEKLNMPIQGGAAEVMLLALVYCHRSVHKLGGAIVNIVHDELVLEVPHKHEQQCAEQVKAAMNKAFADYCDFLDVREVWDVADVTTGADWSCKLQD